LPGYSSAREGTRPGVRRAAPFGFGRHWESRAAGPSCGTLPYGRWPSVNERLVDDGTGTGRRGM